MNILVTGYAGFVGKHVTKELLQHNHTVIGVDDYSHSKPLMPAQGLTRIERNIRAGISDQKSIDAVVHLAAIPSIEWCESHLLEAEMTHIGGTARLLQDSKKLGVNKFVFASSAAVYGDLSLPHNEEVGTKPLSVYARHKVIGEKLVSGSGINGFSLRFFNLYGEGQDPKSSYSGVITNFLRCRSRGCPVNIYGDGLQTRDFVYVADVARAVRLACEKQVSGLHTLNIGTGVGTTIQELAGIISFQIPLYSSGRNNEVRHSIASVQKAKEVLGWESLVDLPTGIRLIW